MEATIMANHSGSGASGDGKGPALPDLWLEVGLLLARPRGEALLSLEKSRACRKSAGGPGATPSS